MKKTIIISVILFMFAALLFAAASDTEAAPKKPVPTRNPHYTEPAPTATPPAIVPRTKPAPTCYIKPFCGGVRK